MKQISLLLALIILLLSLCSCAAPEPQAQVAATTLPVYEFTSRICEGTDISVTQLVTESVSCLHDYSLNVSQVRAAEAAELIVISGAGMEDFMEDLLADKAVVDCSAGIDLIEATHDHSHEQEVHEHEGHQHEEDLTSGCLRKMPRSWLRISVPVFPSGIRNTQKPSDRIWMFCWAS